MLTAVGTRQWTYILPAVPPLAILAAARLGSSSGVAARWRAWSPAACGAPLLVASAAAFPATSADLPPFLGHFAVALLLFCAPWLLAARRLPAVLVAAGASAFLTAGVVDGALVQENLVHVYRGFDRDVATLSQEDGRSRGPRRPDAFVVELSTATLP